MIRLGLCCIFRKEKITFKRTTVAYISKCSKKKRLAYLNQIILHNADSLFDAVHFCKKDDIGAFRINSRFFPLKTHPQFGYELKELPDKKDIVKKLELVKHFCIKNDIRLTFHPDQFVLLSSPSNDITKRSLKELLYHAQLAQLLDADVITIHGGGIYNDKKSALERVKKRIKQLPKIVKEKLTLENDDKSYTPTDLLNICEQTQTPFVYDVHHHRCNKDDLSITQATKKSIATWNREPLFHISSPIHGWGKNDINQHSDYIAIKDFPAIWLNYNLTVDVEAKAKELAVIKLKHDLRKDKNETKTNKK